MAKDQEAKPEGRKIQIVIFRLGNEEFGAPINSVLEISRMMDITRIPQAPGFIEGMINLRGQVIAVIDLKRQFNFLSSRPFPKTSKIVVVQVKEETFGLIVDDVPEVLRVPEGDIETAPEAIQSGIKRHYISGVAKVGERLIIVLDLARILTPDEVESMGKLSLEAKEADHG